MYIATCSVNIAFMHIFHIHDKLSAHGITHLSHVYIQCVHSSAAETTKLSVTLTLAFFTVLVCVFCRPCSAIPTSFWFLRILWPQLDLVVDEGRITTRGGGGGGGGEGDGEYVSRSGSTVVDLSIPGEFSIICLGRSVSLVTYIITETPVEII